jgi:arylsulfatase A-like enzyme
VNARLGAVAVGAALACALACLAAVALAALLARPSDRQQVVRLLERCRQEGARFEWEAEPVPDPPAAPLARWRFRGHRSTWLLLDELLRPQQPGDAAASSWTPRKLTAGSETGEDVLRFPTGRGGLAQVVTAAPQRLLRITARARRAPAGAALPPESEARQALLVVQPLQRPIDLAAELARRDWAALTGDPRVRVGAHYLWASAPTPANGRFESISLTFFTPGATQALLVVFGAGDGAGGAPVDLEEIVLEEVSLRGFFGLGAAAREETASARTAPMNPRELPLLPPADPARPALRAVEDLLERRDALVLAPPGRASFEADLPDGDLVLELGLARLHEARRAWNRAPIEFELRVAAAEGGGREIRLSETLPGGGPAGFQDRSLDLSALAGRRARFTFSATSRGSPDLVAVGSPLVRRRAPRDPRRNVIVVSLDTVRADHLSCEGYPRPTTPCLDALAREGAWFRDVSSTASYTLPAHASLFSGQLPSRHGAESATPGRDRISTRRSRLLAQELRDAGWLTAAFTGGVYLAADFGFDRGFDRYDETDLLLEPDDPRAHSLPRPGDPEFNARQRRARTLDHALEWIRAHQDGRFLLFLHTYLVHDYLAAPEHEARFHGSCASRVARGDLGFVRDRTIAQKPAAADLDHFVDSYDAALHQADRAVGRLRGTLRELRLDDRTWLVVTSDHGEEFGDHGGVNHGRTLHEEVVRVPLFLAGPGVSPREIRDPVSLVDVAPTLLELLGLWPRHEMDGRSLAPFLRGEALSPAPLQAELNLVKENRWAMRRTGDRKAISVLDERGAEELEEAGAQRRPPRRHVFAPRADPGETLDRAQEQGEASEGAAALLDELEEQRASMRERRAAAKRAAEGGELPIDRVDLGLGGYVEETEKDE